MMKKSDPAQLLSYGLHLGHTRTKVHPKSNKYIFKLENGTSIIDLFQTAELLDEAKNYIFELGKAGKSILFVGTKKVAREAITELCKEHNIFYMTNKWTAGLLTNFQEISKNITNMNSMRAASEAGDWNSLIKHERTGLEKKLRKIASVYGGVAQMTKLPDAIFIMDIKKEKNALTEGVQLKIPTIAVTDTNVNPDLVTYPIPANDDAVTSVNFIIDEIVKVYVEGRNAQDPETKKQNAVETTTPVTAPVTEVKADVKKDATSEVDAAKTENAEQAAPKAKAKAPAKKPTAKKAQAKAKTAKKTAKK